ncbi:BTB/POZ domain-containing protein 6-like [Haliotis asinina]|uniref:BTB/POZ domain-containing protein 6-like n=1 Tax=Haliotis asinina TaxID=109174 RepID=UPI0035322C12
MAASDIRPGFVDNWQAGKTVAECNRRMFDTEESCDVTFRVGSSGQVIKAHSYVLISRSCVFHAMFTGSLAERSDVSVPEIEPSHFRQCLLYLYTDDADIDADNATGLLYASRKYDITALELKCLDFLKMHLSVDNACVILEAADRFDEKQLYQEALTLVKNEGEQSLLSSGFLALSQQFVDEILESDDLAAREHVIFTAVNNWAEAECGRQGRAITPQAKKSILGDTLMKVRFPLLKSAFLEDEVKASGLLSDSERRKILDYRDNPGNGVHPFNTKERTANIKLPMHYVHRYRTETLPCVRNSSTHSISFSTSNDVMLLGYQLYGPHTPSGVSFYNVTSTLDYEDADPNAMIHDAQKYEVNEDTFDVLWEKAVAISANLWYTLEVEIRGHYTCCGTGGREQVACDATNVIFNFRNSNQIVNGTRVTQGQIPALIYCPA